MSMIRIKAKLISGQPRSDYKVKMAKRNVATKLDFLYPLQREGTRKRKTIKNRLWLPRFYELSKVVLSKKILGVVNGDIKGLGPKK